MPDNEAPDEDEQTTPEGAEREAVKLPGKGGTTIPVPERDDVFGNLAKVAKPKHANGK